MPPEAYQQARDSLQLKRLLYVPIWDVQTQTNCNFCESAPLAAQFPAFLACFAFGFIALPIVLAPFLKKHFGLLERQDLMPTIKDILLAASITQYPAHILHEWSGKLLFYFFNRYVPMNSATYMHADMQSLASVPGFSPNYQNIRRKLGKTKPKVDPLAGTLPVSFLPATFSPRTWLDIKKKFAWQAEWLCHSKCFYLGYFSCTLSCKSKIIFYPLYEASYTYQSPAGTQAEHKILLDAITLRAHGTAPGQWKRNLQRSLETAITLSLLGGLAYGVYKLGRGVGEIAFGHFVFEKDFKMTF
jgi:hypothetical protein